MSIESTNDDEPSQPLSATFISPQTEVYQFIENYIPGFDLSALLVDLDKVAYSWQFEWTRIIVKITPSGNLQIYHEYDHGDFEERPLSTSTIFRKPVDSHKHVVLDELILPMPFQERGLSAELLHPYYVQ